QRLVFKSTHHVANVIAVGLATASLCASATVIDIKTLSTHADRVSGGDVLAQITTDAAGLSPATLNGVDVSSMFRPGTTPNTFVGLVTGLNLGRNTLAAGERSLVTANYSIKGPSLSGPCL